MPFGCVAFEAFHFWGYYTETLAMSPMPFGCVAFEGTMRAIVKNYNGNVQSPMPFGSVAFEAWFRLSRIVLKRPGLQCLSAVWPLRPSHRRRKHPLRARSLQCLSAVWPLRPLAIDGTLYSPYSASPMPFGCVAFEAATHR